MPQIETRALAQVLPGRLIVTSSFLIISVANNCFAPGINEHWILCFTFIDDADVPLTMYVQACCCDYLNNTENVSSSSIYCNVKMFILDGIC